MSLSCSTILFAFTAFHFLLVFLWVYENSDIDYLINDPLRVYKDWV